MPCVGTGGRLELSVRELTPIQEISEDNRPYAITAQSAVQDKDIPSRVRLETVNGESQRSNGDIVKMRMPIPGTGKGA